MLQGRWRSDAFLLYIRVQVTAFSTGLSNAMVHDSNNFYTVPDTHIKQKNNQNTNSMFNFDIVTDPADPRNRNTRSYATNLNNGLSANNQRVLRPSIFSIFS